jgi:hypothetical protein
LVTAYLLGQHYSQLFRTTSTHHEEHEGHEDFGNVSLNTLRAVLRAITGRSVLRPYGSFSRAARCQPEADPPLAEIAAPLLIFFLVHFVSFVVFVIDA